MQQVRNAYLAATAPGCAAHGAAASHTALRAGALPLCGALGRLHGPQRRGAVQGTFRHQRCKRAVVHGAGARVAWIAVATDTDNAGPPVLQWVSTPTGHNSSIVRNARSASRGAAWAYCRRQMIAGRRCVTLGAAVSKRARVCVGAATVVPVATRT